MARGAPGGTPSGVDAAEVREFLAQSLADNEFAHGFDATLSIDGETNRHRMVSDDLSTTFETLVTWFLHNAAEDTPPSKALGLLLARSDVSVQLPPSLIKDVAVEHGLSPDDSIGDLLQAARDEGSITFE